jgi:hypothetical protein
LFAHPFGCCASGCTQCGGGNCNGTQGCCTSEITNGSVECTGSNARCKYPNAPL